MTFDHIVKFNDILYPAGVDVPIETDEVKVDTNVEAEPISEVPRRRGRASRKE